jgi:gamma-glutamyltranspeptidase/glutathione hydrolase
MDGGRAMMKRRMLAAALMTAALAAPVAQANHRDDFVKEPTAVGKGGAAGTVDALATKAAIDTPKRGGNAVDATVAAAGVLGVTEPFSAGIGGGGFMVIRTPQGRVTTIDGREKAPYAMRPDSFIENGTALAFDPARFSGLSAGVPGTVAQWDEALDRYGRLSLRKALKPGIEVASRGFTVDQTFVDQTTPVVDYFNDVPSTAAIYLDPDGTPRDVGSTLRNPDLAKTYELIARYGPRAFYSGPVARAMAQAAQHPPVANANHVWRPGLMTERDLARYDAVWREPTRVGYKGLDVWGMGPPSSGGVAVGEALNILEGLPLSARDRTRSLHYYLEASRLAFADRNAYLADPDYFDVPLSCLLSDRFAAERRALITETAGTSPAAAGSCPTRGHVSASSEGPSTTHLTVADDRGYVVSYTFTIESTGGNGIVVPGYGFLLNNELTDFNYNSTTHPNRAEGGKRPRSSMSPTIITRDGRPFLAVGSPGGSMIITTVLQTLVERLELGKTLPQAIASPRASQRDTATTIAEPGFAPEKPGLTARGHVFGADQAEIGAVTGIEFLPHGRFLAAAEPVRRGGGSAAVVKRK